MRRPIARGREKVQEEKTSFGNFLLSFPLLATKLYPVNESGSKNGRSFKIALYLKYVWTFTYPEHVCATTLRIFRASLLATKHVTLLLKTP